MTDKNIIIEIHNSNQDDEKDGKEANFKPDKNIIIDIQNSNQDDEKDGKEANIKPPGKKTIWKWLTQKEGEIMYDYLSERRKDIIWPLSSVIVLYAIYIFCFRILNISQGLSGGSFLAFAPFELMIRSAGVTVPLFIFVLFQIYKRWFVSSRMTMGDSIEYLTIDDRTIYFKDLGCEEAPYLLDTVKNATAGIKISAFLIPIAFYSYSDLSVSSFGIAIGYWSATYKIGSFFIQRLYKHFISYNERLGVSGYTMANHGINKMLNVVDSLPINIDDKKTNVAISSSKEIQAKIDVNLLQEIESLQFRLDAIDTESSSKGLIIAVLFIGIFATIMISLIILMVFS